MDIVDKIYVTVNCPQEIRMIIGKDKNKCHHVVIHKICVYGVRVGVSNVSSPVDFNSSLTFCFRAALLLLL